MSKSDWLLLALNVLTLMMAAVGLAAQHTDPMTLALMLTLVAVSVNSALTLRRGGRREREPAPRREALPDAETDLDARRILDIDARLDALERAEDRRLRMLAVEGTLTAPAAEPETASEPGAERRNGVR